MSAIPYDQDQWVQELVSVKDKPLDFRGMRLAEEEVGLQHGSEFTSENQDRFEPHMRYWVTIGNHIRHYRCKTPNQVRMLPQRIHEARVESAIQRFVLTPVAWVLGIVVLIVVLMAGFWAVDAYIWYRIGVVEDHMREIGCLYEHSLELVDSARCGAENVKLSLRISFLYKAVIWLVVMALGMALGIVVALAGYFALSKTLVPLVKVASPGPAPKGSVH